MFFDRFGEQILDGERLFLNNLIEIIGRLDHAKKFHPKSEWQKMSVTDAMNALQEEVDEVKQAIEKESEERMRDELLDVIAVAIRMLNGEYKK